ncbi:MAG: hypothetical protein WDO12_03405 [Pseudomonadota bacterium]
MKRTTTTRTSPWLQRLSVLLLALLATAQTLAAERPWHRLEAEHYAVLSQLDDADTLGWTRDFDQFIAALSSLLGINPKQLPPLTVVLFARDKDFTPYKLMRPNGRTANLAGEFVRQRTWSVIGIADNAYDEELRETIYHEATHWLMSADEARHPAWYSEGIAELLATFEYKGKKVNFAKPIGRNIATLQLRRMIPLREFLTQPSALYDRDDNTDLFYAQAWAFMHFLIYSGDPLCEDVLTRFIETFKTHSGDATIDEVFGDKLPDVEKAFHNYIQRTRFTYNIAPSVPTKELPKPVVASAESVEAALGFLALGANHDDLASEHAHKAIELDPLAPGGHEILAYLYMQGQAIDRAAAQARDALDGGSRDSDMYMMLGDSFVRGANADLQDADRQRANLYEKAINLNPRRAEPYERLTETMFNMESPAETDRTFLAQGLAVFPGNDWLRVGAAAVAFRQGRRDDASEDMNRALLPNSTLNDQQRSFATGFLRSMRFQQMNHDLRDALDRKDMPAAQAAATQMLAEPDLPAGMRDYLLSVRDAPATEEKPTRKPATPAKKKPQKK